MIQGQRLTAFSNGALKALLAVYGSILLVGLLLASVLHPAAASFNQALLLGLHAHATPSLDHLALALSTIGSIKVVAIAGALLAAGLVATKHRFQGFLLAFVLAGAAGIGFVLKHLVQEPRPHLFEQLSPETSSSFPSGHTLMSVSLLGFLAAWLLVLAPGQREAWRRLVAVAAGMLACLIGLSRIYLGVHWPTDVLASLAIGTGWLFLCLFGAQRLATTR